MPVNENVKKCCEGFLPTLSLPLLFCFWPLEKKVFVWCQNGQNIVLRVNNCVFRDFFII